ncbi:MAG: SDR family oxidoreductase [bacterium]|nr:SDR family oxidoreductase [bacterium]
MPVKSKTTVKSKKTKAGESPAFTRPKSRVIAITGTRSFIGSNLLQRLQQEGRHQLVALDLEKPDFLKPATRFYKLDLTSTTADVTLSEILEREKCDTFIHLAFLSSPTHKSSYAHELESVGTMYVFHACAKNKVKKIIVSSTTMVYGALPINPNFLVEESPLRGNREFRPIRDRIEVEEHAQNFQKKHPETTVTVLRPCTILGPTIRNFITTYLSLPVITTLLGYDPLVQFVHEEDALDAYRLAVERDCRGVFNIVGRGVLPLSTIVKLSGKVKAPILHAFAYPMVEGLWLAQVGIAPAAYLDYIRYLWVADGSKARKELGFFPKYSTKESLEAFLGIQRLRAIHLVE